MYTKVMDLIENNDYIDVEAETEIYGCNHIEVGAEISKLWRLPRELISIISFHPTPGNAKDFVDLVAVVRFADLLCEMWGADMCEGFKYVDLVSEESWKILCQANEDMNDLDVEIFTFELEEEFKKSSQFLNVMLSE